MNSPVITVTQLNFYLKSIIEGDENLRNVYVCGEISNFTNHYRSGHFYMVLKDAESSIKAIMFRSNAQRLRFAPENGMMIIARGRISVYERDGQYQLYIDDMQPYGVGALSVAYEQLKKSLASEGLFDEKYKKTIPTYPLRIGVVTSPTGAAIQDVLNVLSRRFPLAQVILCPVEVQGVNAAPQIVKAIKRFNAGKYADVLIVGRGGGSIEDLWSFNEEKVARAVFASEIPIISAVGHETDFTICDFVADLRAPTPSAAAELAVPNQTVLNEHINQLKYSLINIMNADIEKKRAFIESLVNSHFFSSPLYYIDIKRQTIDSLVEKLSVCMKREVNEKLSALSLLCGKLHTLSPLKVLARGYSLTLKNSSVVSSINQVQVGDKVDVMLKDGILNCSINSKAE
jgi:exodeoxyribonuclease VII large subunit